MGAQNKQTLLDAQANQTPVTVTQTTHSSSSSHDFTQDPTINTHSTMSTGGSSHLHQVYATPDDVVQMPQAKALLVLL